ncbi:hypothetical protein [Paraburkholderia youngii]|uniref:Uncharacterized protein n=1 Tax=Paraburkholderia youngii TaxID=2782701 RepID=A0A7Y6MVV0_9BURK|nr:hypothetical protein [Paraburkholderia youngii]NUX98757.1 hypothetical protein [Paraburkholderia youngii]
MTSYIILAFASVSAAALGYVWGWDIGYHDRINDETGAELRSRIYKEDF